MNVRRTKWVICLTFIAAGVGIIIATTLPKSMQYYVTADELLANPPRYMRKELKVAGKVDAGSVAKSDGDLSWNFRVVNAGKMVSVVYSGAMPDTFKEGADVVVTGTFTPPDRLVATHVLAKCASRYEEKLKPSY